MRSRVPKVSKTVRDSHCSQLEEFPKRTKLYNCNIYAECRGQSHAGSQVDGSNSVSSCEPRLVDSVSSLVMPLILLAPTILTPSLLKDFPKLCLIFDCESASVSISCYWMKPLWAKH